MEADEKFSPRIELLRGVEFSREEKEEIVSIISNCFIRFDFISSAQIEYMLSTLGTREMFCSEFIVYRYGGIKAFLSFEYHDNLRLIKIDKFFCSPKWQNMGIGSSLLEFLFSYAAIRSVEKIWLYVNKKNRAVKLYKRKGFYIKKSIKEPIGKRFYKDDFLMEKII